MTETKNLICFTCMHWSHFETGCKAFPEGMPDSILQKNKHDKPLKDQTNKLVYESVQKDKKFRQ